MVSTLRVGEDSPIVKVYDIETSQLMETYEVRSSKPSSKATPPTMPEAVDVIPSKAALIAEIAANRDVPPDAVETPSVLALMIGQSFASLVPPQPEGGLLSVPEKSTPVVPGWMVTAGEDRVVRYWDLAKVTESFVVCGSQREKEVTFRQGTTTPTMYYTLPNSHRQSLDRHAGVATQRQPLRPHYDAICALGTIETPFSSCVITGDRSGVVKVWRMESQARGQA